CGCLSSFSGSILIGDLLSRRVAYVPFALFTGQREVIVMILCRIASCSAPMRAFFLPKALVSVIFDTLFRWKQSLEKDETLILMLFKTHSRVLQQVQRRNCVSEISMVSSVSGSLFKRVIVRNRWW
uniref:Secreted protein n=2 Tax=Parascaris univalens TaxID=6257 RepID=A0A915A5J7_PARUN